MSPRESRVQGREVIESHHLNPLRAISLERHWDEMALEPIVSPVVVPHTHL